MRSIPRRIALAVFVALFFAGAAAKADVILLVDISDPGNVTFTATNAVSQQSAGPGDINDGITLQGFFTSNFDFNQAIGSSTLGAAITNPADSFYSVGINNTNDVGLQDLNFFAGGGPTQEFIAGQLALVGSGSLNMTGAPLPQFGATGNIVFGDTNLGSAPIIGQWRAISSIPEPSSLGILALSGLFLFRRRRSV